MSSQDRLWKVYKTIYLNDIKLDRKKMTKAMAIRFCEEYAGNFEFIFSNMEK
jgi:hypothetical protein